ncbi:MULTISPECIES: hypothetical protein [Sphingobacterium]|uniref:hypothetical protein n=1 Tax=Sphingobacterium TaxID=28453 RepID=UPI0025795EF0|nr:MULTISPECIES: hypothetical protein [Sphingobacterium]
MNINDYNPVQTTPFSIKDKILSRIWKVVNATIFKFLPYNFNGYRRQILKMFGANIVGSVSVDRTARIDFPWNLTMANLSSIGKNTWIYCLDKIVIGEKTCIGDDVYLITGTHDIKDKKFSLVTAPIFIGNGVWLTTGVKIMPGVSISNFSVVGAFSIVTRDIPENQVWVGSPAKYIKNRFDEL